MPQAAFKEKKRGSSKMKKSKKSSKPMKKGGRY